MSQKTLRTEFHIDQHQPSDNNVLKESYSQTASAQLKVYRIILQKDEDGHFVATCQDLPGVVTDGATEEEAMENAWYAVSDMLSSLGKPEKEFNLSLVLTL